MCQVCMEWQKGKLTGPEAIRAIGELQLEEADADHLYYLMREIAEKEND